MNTLTTALLQQHSTHNTLSYHASLTTLLSPPHSHHPTHTTPPTPLHPHYFIDTTPLTHAPHSRHRTHTTSLTPPHSHHFTHTTPLLLLSLITPPTHTTPLTPPHSHNHTHITLIISSTSPSHTTSPSHPLPPPLLHHPTLTPPSSFLPHHPSHTTSPTPPHSQHSLLSPFLLISLPDRKWRSISLLRTLYRYWSCSLTVTYYFSIISSNFKAAWYLSLCVMFDHCPLANVLFAIKL